MSFGISIFVLNNIFYRKYLDAKIYYVLKEIMLNKLDHLAPSLKCDIV